MNLTILKYLIEPFWSSCVSRVTILSVVIYLVVLRFTSDPVYTDGSKVSLRWPKSVMFQIFPYCGYFIDPCAISFDVLDVSVGTLTRLGGSDVVGADFAALLFIIQNW